MHQLMGGVQSVDDFIQSIVDDSAEWHPREIRLSRHVLDQESAFERMVRVTVSWIESPKVMVDQPTSQTSLSAIAIPGCRDTTGAAYAVLCDSCDCATVVNRKVSKECLGEHCEALG